MWKQECSVWCVFMSPYFWCKLPTPNRKFVWSGLRNIIITVDLNLNTQTDPSRRKVELHRTFFFHY